MCSITVGVLDGPARSGRGSFHGVCSNCLAGLPAGATVFGFVRKPTIAFRPPENPHLSARRRNERLATFADRAEQA